MSEHFLRESELNSFRLLDYTTASSFCRSSMEKGGVCILIKNNLSYQTVDADKFCSEGYCELAAIKFQLLDVSYILLAVYRPPHKGVHIVDDFLESLRTCLDFIAKPNTRILIAGDFNIDMSVDDHSSRKLSDLMLSFGLHDTVYSYSREFKGSKSLIDNVFCNICPKVLKTEVVVSGISDHHAQVSEIKLAVPLKDEIPKFKFKRSFGDDNCRIFKTLLKSEEWDKLFSANSIDDKLDCFNSILNYYFELSFPYKKSKIGPSKFFTRIKLDHTLLRMREDLLNMFYSTKDLEQSHPLKIGRAHV